VALKTSILRGDHLNREKLELALREVMLAIKQIIEGSKLAQAEKLEIFQNLSQIPIIIAETKRDQTKALSRQQAAAGNGNGRCKIAAAACPTSD
jgi:hypothetical protein